LIAKGENDEQPRRKFLMITKLDIQEALRSPEALNAMIKKILKVLKKLDGDERKLKRQIKKLYSQLDDLCSF